jgi:aspartyl/asparaginyl beta-hydroxylase (cupin superfamily)
MTETSTLRERYWKAIKQPGFRMLKAVERLITRYSEVDDKTFFEVEDFPWVRNLETNWSAIRAELDELLKQPEALPNFQDVSKDQYVLSKDDKWKTFFLFGFGFKQQSNCLKCPETTKMMEQIPGMKSAMFSILAPGKHIKAHRGPYKGVLRCHLGLIVPEPKDAIRIRVGTDIRLWEEGKCMIFDDTFEHEVWHEGTSDRVVLFIDFVRPLRQPAKAINNAIIKLIAWSPFVQDARKNLDAWERKIEKARPTNPPKQ